MEIGLITQQGPTWKSDGDTQRWQRRWERQGQRLRVRQDRRDLPERRGRHAPRLDLREPPVLREERRARYRAEFGRSHP